MVVSSLASVMAKSHKKRRLEQRFGKKHKDKQRHQTQQETIVTQQRPVHHARRRGGFYDVHYKKLLIIPFLILFLALVVIGYQYFSTGDFINRGISLKGGTAITLTQDMVDLQRIDVVALEESLREDFPRADIGTRIQRQITEVVAIDVEVDITEEAQLETFKEALVAKIDGLTMDEIGENIRTSGSSLGASFFRQILQAMIVAFILMGIVVFIQFRVPVPSMAVILAAFSDIVVTLAVVNLLGIKISTAGIAAFLMIIGYSVDTDILLSTRVLKSKEGSVYSRIISALKTGLTMNITTLSAVAVALIVSESPVITQIMTIIFIGLLVDMINTWLQNAGILRMYAEKKEKEEKVA